MGVVVQTKAQFGEDDFNNLPFFEKFKEKIWDVRSAIHNDDHLWHTLGENGEKKDIVYRLNILFIGQTGMGKSTTINTITNTNLMETDPIDPCTKEMNCIKYHIGWKEYICVCDMPGIGETQTADEQYYEWYKDMFYLSDCIVYVLRADERNYSIDINEFNYLKSLDNTKRIIIALNGIDKIEPTHITPKDSYFYLSEEQQYNLERKIQDVSRIFQIPTWDIIPYSAKRNYRMSDLDEKICNISLYNLNI